MSMARKATLATMVAAVVLPATAVAVNPGSATTSTGQTLNVRIDTPADGSTVPVAPLTVTGVAGLGTLGTGGGANLAYVVDNSGSTERPTDLDCNGSGGPDPGDNFNGDARTGDVLDCEIAGVLALNNSIASSGAAAGLVSFGSTAAASDVSPAAGDQPSVRVSEDGNGNGQRDIEEAARSITSSGAGQFTPKSSGGGTDFDTALSTMNALFSGGGVAYFLSDGQASVNTSAGGPLDQAKSKGIVVNTFSVGSAAAGCDPGSSLRTIADTTGGECKPAPDPSQLAAQISGGGAPRLAGLDRVELTMNGQTVPAALNAGAFSGQFPAAALRNGANRVVATAVATDGTRAAADVTVNVRGAGSGSKPPAFGPRGVIQGLPSNRRCVSRRAFRIRIVRRRGRTYVAASVRVNGRVVLVRRGRRVTSVVNLRGLPKGRYTVDIRVVTSIGEVIKGVRRYKTCTKKERGRNRIPL